VVLLLAGLLILPAWINPDGFPWSLLSQWVNSDTTPLPTEEDLAYKKTAWAWRNESKKKVVKEYLKGGLTPLEAVAWFNQLNNQPAQMKMARPLGWMGTRSQWACQDLINWAHNEQEISSDPKVPPAVKRLEEDLKQYLGPPQRLELPTPPKMPAIPPCPDRESFGK
jgi:hypothetical protein